MISKVSDIIFEIQRKYFSKKIIYSENNRPASIPYISGDSFRSIAHYIYDEINQNGTPEITNTIDPQAVRHGQIIFIGADKLEEYFNKIHTEIKHPYILVSHNGDISISEKYEKYIDDKIICWFAQNVVTKNNKIIPIPIGVENLWKYKNGRVQAIAKVLIDNPKKNRILYGFRVNTNKEEREEALAFLNSFKWADGIEKKLNPSRYLKVLNNYKFVASPPGNGVDCHRTWEALYLNVIPIVKKSPCMEYFSDLGLPLWVIESWDELNDYDDRKLCLKYKEMIGLFEREKIYFDYWKTKITKYC